MRRLKTLAVKILRPSVVWIYLLTLMSGAAVIVTLATGADASVIGYISYALSAYSLAVLIINFTDIRKKTKAFIQDSKAWASIKTFLYSHKYSKRYMTDISYRVKFSLFSSLILNVVYAAFKLIAGIYYASFWYGADAIYYIVMSVARIMLTRHMQKGKGGLESEYKIYRVCGVFMLALNAALTGVVYQIINQNMGYKYPGLLIYAVATFTFINIITTIVSAVKFRKLNSPLLSAVKAVNLAKAMVSMFALQSAMFASFGDVGGTTERLMNTIFGGCLCLAIFGMAVFMIVKASVNIKRNRSY